MPRFGHDKGPLHSEPYKCPWLRRMMNRTDIPADYRDVYEQAILRIDGIFQHVGRAIDEIGHEWPDEQSLAQIEFIEATMRDQCGIEIKCSPIYRFIQRTYAHRGDPYP